MSKNLYIDGELVSFILTTWYVNLSLSKVGVINVSSFILTTWYVNRLAAPRLAEAKDVLY